MQPTVFKDSNRERSSGKKKTSSRRNYLGGNEQASFSIELWRKAFKDAHERLCPIQARGQTCGCLSALIILVSLDILCMKRLRHDLIYGVEYNSLDNTCV